MTLLSVSVFAQGSRPGRSTPTPIKTPKPVSTPAKTPKPVSTPVKPPRPRSTPIIPRPTPMSSIAPKPLPARFWLDINEPESEIFIENDEGSIFEDAGSYTTDEYRSPLQYNDFPVGTYTLIVRKNGFFPEERRITISSGKLNHFSVNLRPSAAFLSVSTNVDGAKIEIENFDVLENEIKAYPLSPGRYRLRVSKNGYETETREIILKDIGNREYFFINLRESPAAALGKGGKVQIRLRIQINNQLSPGNLIIERQRLTFQGENSSLDFVITRGNASDFIQNDDSTGSYIEFKAHGVFGNKFDQRKRPVRLYPNSQDAKSIFQLLESWRLGSF